MLPTGINIAGVFIQLNVPPCLHEAFTISETSGTDHPKYPEFTNTFSFPATNFTTRPASILGSVSTRPWRGGYLRRKVTVYRPETA
jgi:hypothetical protein